MVLNIAVMILLFVFTISVDNNNVLMVSGTIVAIFIYICLYKMNNKISSYEQQPESYFLFPRIKKQIILYFVILSYCIEQLFKYIYTTNFKAPHNQERANESAEKHTLLESIISSDIKAPVIEEIIFRGLLFLVVVVVSNLISNNANKRIVNIVFIITSVIIFGLFHCVSWNELFTNMVFTTEFEKAFLYIVPGIIYSLLYVSTQRLYIPILAHMLNNILGLTLFGEQQLENLIVWFVILMIIGTIYIKVKKKIMKGNRGIKK